MLDLRLARQAKRRRCFLTLTKQLTAGADRAVDLLTVVSLDPLGSLFAGPFVPWPAESAVTATSSLSPLSMGEGLPLSQPATAKALPARPPTRGSAVRKVLHNNAVIASPDLLSGRSSRISLGVETTTRRPPASLSQSSRSGAEEETSRPTSDTDYADSESGRAQVEASAAEDDGVRGPRAFLETSVATDGVQFSFSYALRDLHRDLLRGERPEPWYYKEPPRLPLHADSYHCDRGSVARSRR